MPVLWMMGTALAATVASDCALTAPVGPHTEPIEDRVRFRRASAPGVAKAVDWLSEHVYTVDLPGVGSSSVVAWWDATLSADTRDVVAYTVTDALWTARALRPYEPRTAGALEDTLMGLGWNGNGLQEVLFTPRKQLAFLPFDADRVHGAEIGRCTLAGGARLQLRTPRMKVDRGASAGHPTQFVDSAVYDALRLHWAGERGLAKRRLRRAFGKNVFFLPDRLFWDKKRGVLVDAASRRQYERFKAGAGPYDNATYKLGLVLYAARVVGLDKPVLADLRAAMWDAQWSPKEAERVGHPDGAGGLSHTVRHEPGGGVKRAAPTAEATAIAVLSETVQP